MNITPLDYTVTKRFEKVCRKKAIKSNNSEIYFFNRITIVRLIKYIILYYLNFDLNNWDIVALKFFGEGK